MSNVVFVHKLPASAAPWAYAIQFDYNVDFIEALKTYIHSRSRRYQPSNKVWLFKASVIEDVATLAHIHTLRVVHVEGDEDTVPAISPEVEAAYRELHLLPSAPPDVVKAAYRAMCKLHHPDAGGTTRQMQRVNEAYGRLTHR